MLNSYGGFCLTNWASTYKCSWKVLCSPTHVVQAVVFFISHYLKQVARTSCREPFNVSIFTDVAFWKYYRWVDWARRHGLYEAYDCPRTRFLKVNGLMKLSYAPHLLDVQSTESVNIFSIYISL